MKEWHVELPWDRRYSKNLSMGSRDSHGKYRRKDSKAAQDELAFLVRTSGRWVTARIHVDILVVMPRFLSDAVNYVDTICDAVRDGTGVDDKWFSCSVDWDVDKERARIEVRLSQEETVDQAFCPTCSKFMPADDFYYAGARRMDKCKECHKKKMRDKRRATENVLESYRAG